LKPAAWPTPTLLLLLESPAGNISARWIDMYRTLHSTATTTGITVAHLLRLRKASKRKNKNTQIHKNLR